ncbi:cytochrome P450 [Mycena metata]|uniref:Cytochrome P450 n=1 Tax=Mycena metata TaxID=1033252 RepID=A0AAD7K673_9AGAR|nr:cytochrome P450 [Mycena metata]
MSPTAFLTESLLQPRFLPWIVFGGYAAHLVLYVFLYRMILYPRFFSPLRHLPGPPLGNPFVGQFLTIVRSKTCIPQRDWANKYGPVVRQMGLMGEERLILLSPEALQQYVVAGWLEYPRPQFIRDVMGMIVGYGLFTVTGEEHKKLRRQITPAFAIPNLMAQTDMYYEPIEGLLEIMKSELKAETDAGKVFPIYEWMCKVTLDIICETAFGYKTDCLHNPSNELAVAFESIAALQTGTNLAKLIFVISLPGVSRLSRSAFLFRHRLLLRRIPGFRDLGTLLDGLYRIRAISRELLRAKTADLSVSPDDMTTKKDIMSLLVKAKKTAMDAGEDSMSDQAMLDQMLTFLAAGHETTATGLSWTLWLLANDPESQRRLREEVTPIYEANPRPDYRTIKSLTWLDCVINESLRVLPPVSDPVRVAAKTGYIDGILVPKGTVFNIPIPVINKWHELWGDDAEEFRPSRWLDLPKAYNPSFSTFTFLSGPHGCIGKTMAVSEMKAVLLALIVNFEFAPSYEGQIAHPAAALTMKPEDNMPLRVTRIAGRD